MAEKLPDFIIIGAQKSATTFLQKCLDEHPEVFVSPNEVRFFEDPEYGEGEAADLAELFEGVDDGLKLGMKRADYLAKPEVPGRIHRHLPGTKLLVTLRNPVERVISAYFFFIKLGFIPAVPLELGLRQLLDGTLERTHAKAKELLEYGFYGTHLERYGRFFDRSQMLILLHDDIIADKKAAVRQTYQFVGVSEEFLPGAIDGKSNPGVYSMQRLRWLRQRNQFMYSYNGNRTKLYRKKKNIASFLIAGGMTALDRLILARVFSNRREEIDPAALNQLRSIYREDVESVGRIIGRDLSFWIDPA